MFLVYSALSIMHTFYAINRSHSGLIECQGIPVLEIFFLTICVQATHFFLVHIDSVLPLLHPTCILEVSCCNLGTGGLVTECVCQLSWFLNVLSELPSLNIYIYIYVYIYIYTYVYGSLKISKRFVLHTSSVRLKYIS